jgi:hypothetical protein
MMAPRSGPLSAFADASGMVGAGALLPTGPDKLNGARAEGTDSPGMVMVGPDPSNLPVQRPANCAAVSPAEPPFWVTAFAPTRDAAGVSGFASIFEAPPAPC